MKLRPRKLLLNQFVCRSENAFVHVDQLRGHGAFISKVFPSATDELLVDRIVREHVPEGVRLPLDPEVVDPLNTVGELERGRLAGVDDDRVVANRGNRPLARAELTGEEVVPRCEAVVRLVDELRLEVRHGLAGGKDAAGVADAAYRGVP